jgi:hypothetical protein
LSLCKRRKEMLKKMESNSKNKSKRRSLSPDKSKRKGKGTSKRKCKFQNSIHSLCRGGQSQEWLQSPCHEFRLD